MPKRRITIRRMLGVCLLFACLAAHGASADEFTPGRHIVSSIKHFIIQIFGELSGPPG